MFGFFSRLFKTGYKPSGKTVERFSVNGYTGEKNGACLENASYEVIKYKGGVAGGETVVVFNDGSIVSGDYKCREWKGGEFKGGTLVCSTFSGGSFLGKRLVCDYFTGGCCKSGFAEVGVWMNGEFEGRVLVADEWKNGVFNGVEFHGKWRGGKWVGGKFHGIDLADGSLNR